MFGPIGGIVPGALPVGIGQLLLADRKSRLTWRRWWRVRHCGIVVAASRSLPPGTVRNRVSGTYYPPDHPVYGGVQPREGFDYHPTGVITAPRLVQAMPSGAEEIDMRQDKHWTAQHIYVRPAYGHGAPDAYEAVRTQAERVAHHARRYVGTPYGFLTYAALAADFLIPNGPAGMRLEGRIARRIIDRGEMICSQLVDQSLTDAGFHVFDDGRLPQDVVPAELFRALITAPGAQYVVPERMDGWAEAGEYLHRDWR